jgi:hypothetical protein
LRKALPGADRSSVMVDPLPERPCPALTLFVTCQGSARSGSGTHCVQMDSRKPG